MTMKLQAFALPWMCFPFFSFLAFVFLIFIKPPNGLSIHESSHCLAFLCSLLYLESMRSFALIPQPAPGSRLINSRNLHMDNGTPLNAICSLQVQDPTLLCLFVFLAPSLSFGGLPSVPARSCLAFSIFDSQYCTDVYLPSHLPISSHCITTIHFHLAIFRCVNIHQLPMFSSSIAF
ncbi:hypothetical protein C8R41DRAFT_833012 [Lentinula lateritia]|uniref:Uncharacterized protein n=1 Tax=Lentinula lateritia TaxID=40482 RepID=A0ABQ8VEQ2_9AGAR|nr:hypothetical protein C8R41DRAFT_833012 [Lentinula lateritia]